MTGTCLTTMLLMVGFSPNLQVRKIRGYFKDINVFVNFCVDFFTDERAKADYKNRLRYLVARYGYSTSVFAWEFFNEVCYSGVHVF